MLRNHFRHLTICLLGWTLITTACSPTGPLLPSPPSKLAWTYPDLRALDAVDAPHPSQDLIAAYARTDEDELHIRLDLLDLPELPDYDLYLAVDAAPGGTPKLPIDGRAKFSWDVLLVIPARGPLQTLRADGSSNEFTPLPRTGLRVQRDVRQDILTISLDKAALGRGYLDFQAIPGVGMEIFVTPAGAKSIADHVEPYYLTAPPPTQARALLVFWNAFSAYTPLQALRRWDGAHTGPFGGRHGLSNLLRAAQSSASPLFLLDLNQPVGLSNLDAIGELETAQAMVSAGLLGLPSVLPGFPTGSETPTILRPTDWALQRAVQDNLRSDAAFGLSSSPYFFSAAGLAGLPNLASESPILSRRIAFIPNPADQPPDKPAERLAPIQAESWNGWTILRVPAYGQSGQQLEQAGVDGPTLPIRQALIESALASQGKGAAGRPILILGGDLPANAWGNPQIARASFDYLQNHPWIHLIGPSELALEQPALAMNTDLASSPVLAEGGEQNLLEALRRAPENALGAAAWHAYRSAFAPVFPVSTTLPTLRAHYAWQVGSLLAAAQWAADPQRIASCSEDPDQDGQTECILASESVYAEFELDRGGYLAYLFVLDQAGGAHQVIAPSALLVSGTGPAEAWDLEQGPLADPQVLPGAILDTHPPSDGRSLAKLTPEALRMSVPGSNLAKTFRLLPDGLSVEVTGVTPGDGYRASIPLTFDPWLRFHPGWTQDFSSTVSGKYWRWGEPTGQTVEVMTQAALSPTASTDQLELLGRPENPDQDAPDGFRLPFPMAEGRLTAESDFSTTIRLSH